MTILRIDIERALDELITNEDDVRFQTVAVVIAKQKWPDLIASERKKDGGLDARAPALASPDKVGIGLACSITSTFAKLSDDAGKAKKSFPDVGLFVFATPRKVSKALKDDWARRLGEEFGFQLEVISREDIITSLMLPMNERLCATLPGILVQLETDDTERLAKVRRAVKEVARNWAARARVVNRPTISLRAVRLDGAGKETNETIDIESIRVALAQSKRLALEAPGGGGKTTTLLQLAMEEAPAELSFLVDLPGWVQRGCDILAFITEAPAFRARGISAEDLAILAAKTHFSFLLNGWNEIGERYTTQAIQALSQLGRDFPSAGILVATRTHYLTPPLPGALRAKLLPFNRRQRADYLQQTLGGRADELRLQLEANRVLDELTRTPMILAEVVAIFQAGAPIPETRVGVLDAVMMLIEGSHEHQARLQGAPLHNGAQHYLTAIAVEMTNRGEVQISGDDARAAVQRLIDARQQVVGKPEPTIVLGALTAHHALEQHDHPSRAYRFQHQLFQEYYAARFLRDEIVRLVDVAEDSLSQAFAATYIDRTMWEESLCMVAEELRVKAEQGEALATRAGVHLVNLALHIDPVFAGALVRLSGPNVWKEIRPGFSSIVRSWYSVADRRHQGLALAAMIETGSDDFADVLIPLLTSKDRNSRIETYEATSAFYPESLGPDWRHLVATWGEEARVDFVFEMTHRNLLAEIGEDFAVNDPSLEVRNQALQELCWIGASDALTRIVGAMDDNQLDRSLRFLYPERIPPVLLPRLAAANRRLLEAETAPLDRIRRLLHIDEYGEAPCATELIKELSLLNGPLDHHAAHAVLEAVKIINPHDPKWVSAWVLGRLLDGSLHGDHWRPFVVSIPERDASDLIEALTGRELPYRESTAIRLILSAAGTAQIAAELFTRLRATQPSGPTRGEQVAAWKYSDQLREAIRAMPLEIAISGIMGCLTFDVEEDAFQTLVDVFGHLDPEAEEMRSALSDPLGEALRGYVKNGISTALAGDLLDEPTRAHAAKMLARVGKPEDMADIRRLIDADIERRRSRNTGTTYSNWYIGALLRLGSEDADRHLLELLCNEEYERDASAGLVQLVRPPVSKHFWFGNSLNFDALWEGREDRKTVPLDQSRSKRYAQAIKERIAALRSQVATAVRPMYFIGRVQQFGIALATIDGKSSADFVIEALKPPGQFDGWARMSGVRALVLSGAILREEDMSAVLNPAIDYALREGYSDQSLTLLVDCLELLLFGDTPAVGIERIEQVMAQFRYRPYQFRDLIIAAGQSRSEAALPFGSHRKKRQRAGKHLRCLDGRRRATEYSRGPPSSPQLHRP